MVDLATGSVVTVENPSVTIETSMPGLVDNVWLKEGPTGPAGAAGTGDVNGPASAVADRIAVFNGTTGKIIKDGGATVALLATLASPTFTGDPKAPTPSTSDNDTSIATTAYVKAQLYATLASPTFTGTPLAPTAAASTDSTQVATTAYVKDAIQGGTVVAAGNLTGAVSMSTHLTAATAVNAVVTATLTGNTTFTAATMPAVSAGTQFAMRIAQDGTGSRTLTLTNIRKPGGVLVLSTTASAVDLVVFFYDGTDWFASLSGKAFAI